MLQRYWAESQKPRPECAVMCVCACACVCARACVRMCVCFPRLGHKMGDNGLGDLTHLWMSNELLALRSSSSSSFLFSRLSADMVHAR